MPNDRHEKHTDIAEDISMGTSSGLLESSVRPGLVKNIHHADDCASQTGIIAQDQDMLQHLRSHCGGFDEYGEWIT
jgi:hypothetical protein